MDGSRLRRTGIAPRSAIHRGRSTKRHKQTGCCMTVPVDASRPANRSRVTIDAAALSDGSAIRGIGTYLRSILGALATSRELTLTGLVKPGAALPAGVHPQIVRRWAPSRWAELEADARLPRDIRNSRPDVAWSPAQSPPRHCSVPWVQTLHDLTPLVFDSPEFDRERRHWRLRGRRLRKAAAVICPSHASARQGVQLLGLPPSRVHVVPHGVDARFHPEPGSRPAPDAPYLLVVSAWGPQKGFTEAFDVAATLANRGLEHRLVVAGQADDWSRGRVEMLRARSRRPDRIDIVGWVEDLPQLYRQADCLIVSSRGEGFGLPILEAMACGTPVVSFDNSSLPEVVGDAGVLVQDGNVAELVNAAEHVLTRPALQRQLAASGIRRSASFTWARAAEATARILTSAATSAAPPLVRGEAETP